MNARAVWTMAAGLAGALITSGCASLSGAEERYLTCPYDTVWDMALETMKDWPVQKKDKDQGIIETGWTEYEGSGRKFGAFSRDAFDSRERSRLSLQLKRINEVTMVSLLENREVWHKQGGASSQANRWWPIDSSKEVLNEVMVRLNKKLKEHGCPPQ